ncbi:hypothetical protein Pla52n_07460 [Stieleria varia]|uniref:Uncharacterized protein n=1 Tax=Stieleria varia TaxID=2528005 RepID=A0A5C6BCG1_9BACT|nr:hypothetical protein Pla52n_07460 [Stieleria varia]
MPPIQKPESFPSEEMVRGEGRSSQMKYRFPSYKVACCGQFRKEALTAQS